MATSVLPQLEITEYRFRLSRLVSPGEATHLRGYFGMAYRDEVLLHHHRADGGLLYDYPRVQFKVLDRAAHLIGINEGGAIVERMWREVDGARIRQEELPILEGTLHRRYEPFGETNEPLTYRFCSPWMALNQDNHRRYEHCPSECERRTLLSRVLIGNCLSLAKSFGHQVGLRLNADVSGLCPSPIRLKGVRMLALRGRFRVNFCLPGWIGIGKSVSRGFGTVEAVGSQA